jgi:hypothetical protein
MNYFWAPFPQGNAHERYNDPNAPVSAYHRKRKYSWVWPRDGRESSSFGRLKDILRGKGPDIFVAKHNAQPIRPSWTNRPALNPFLPSDTTQPMPWARRKPHQQYDFRTRKYWRGDQYTWWDARWNHNKVDRERNYPRAYRCRHGDWYTQHPMGGMGFEIGADGHGPQMPHEHIDVGLPPMFGENGLMDFDEDGEFVDDDFMFA